MKAQDLATHIVKTLVERGYIAYFAGGWVRDFALGHPSSDVDIATSATPDEIISLFPRTQKVGIAFGVVVVVIEGHPFEVATFREDFEYIHGRKPEKIVFSSPEEDAKRRDFTINGMFYDPLTETIHDFVGGLRDLKRGIVQTIGHPCDRFREDRLRMIRAVRFAVRFNFPMEEEMQKAIQEHAGTLFPAVAMERVHQEFVKMARFERFDHALLDLHRLGLLQVIFPPIAKVSLEEIRKLVAPFPRYPKECPVDFYLQALFPEETAEELLEIFLTLRMSNQELKRARFFRENLPFLIKIREADRFFWAKFHANPISKQCVEVVGASLGKKFLEEHRNIKESLSPHIQRIKQGTPLVTSDHLVKLGVAQGPKLGQMLKAAEFLAVNGDLHTSEEVLKLLKGVNHG